MIVSSLEIVTGTAASHHKRQLTEGGQYSIDIGVERRRHE
jgi:hypothetical protein